MSLKLKNVLFSIMFVIKSLGCGKLCHTILSFLIGSGQG